MSYVDLHRMNVERRRADAIVLAAKRANRLEEAASMSCVRRPRPASALPGLGVWTATSTITTSHGDPDTIVLRDYRPADDGELRVHRRRRRAFPPTRAATS